MSQPAPTRRQPPRARPGVSATARLFRSLPPGAPPDWQRAASDAITAGVRIDSPLPRQNGETALMHAAAIGRLDVAVWLLDHGANPNARDRNGRTPLIHAIRGAYLDSQSLERATLLTERGADLDARNHADWTTLGYALWKGHTETTHWLLDHDADPLGAGGSDRENFAAGGRSDVIWLLDGILSEPRHAIARHRLLAGLTTAQQFHWFPRTCASARAERTVKTWSRQP